MRQGGPVTLYREPGLSRSCLVLGWREDLGGLGLRTTNYLIRKLDAKEFAEIEPDDFFALGGVAVEDNIAQFPDSKFYVCPEHELVVLQSSSPAAEWHRFLDSVLDVAVHHCGTRELYMLGAMVSLDAHTAPRQLLSVANLAEMKESLSQYDLARDMDYQTAPGQRPTLNSFLLWVAKERHIPGVSLWVPIPFYVAAMGDAGAQKRVLSFLNERLDLEINFSDLDRQIRQQNEQLAGARSRYPQVDDYIGRLENNLTLSDEENGELLKKIEEFLGEEG